MPFAVIVCVALVLLGLAFAFDRPEEEPARVLAPAPVARIAADVERERGLSFAGTPAVERVTPARARAEAAASLDADYPPARREADAAVLALLGLVPPGLDLGEATLGSFDSAVAGYYDPRARTLRVIEGPASTGNRVVYETTVAHELTHALEDEAFGFDLEALAAGGDRALAYTALVEGTATALMTRYIDRRFGAEETLGSTLASGFAGTGTGDLPPFLTAQLLFPYTAGEAFVGRLLELGGGGWKVVDIAHRLRPPASTEQVLHPEKYVEVEQPVRVALPAAPAGWEVLQRSTLGEWVTAKMLARAGGTTSAAAAAGWGGDAYALLGRGEDRALVARWAWDTPADARDFERALRAWADDGFPDSARDGAVWRGRDGVAVIAAGGGRVTLAIAPERGTALALARAGR